MKYRLLLSSIFLLLFASFSLAVAQDTKYTDSPFLADQIKAGKLPPVAERLPANPRVLDFPWSQPGTYGGDFRDPFVGDSYWSSQMVFWTAWKSLVNWNEDYSDWVPNIAEKVDVSEDATLSEASFERAFWGLVKNNLGIGSRTSPDSLQRSLSPGAR